MEDLIALPIGFLLDLALGDPPAWPHPVRWIGRLIQFLEPRLRRRITSEKWGGIVLLLLVVGLVGGVTGGLLALGTWLHPVVRIALASLLVYLGISVQSLATEAQTVVDLEVAGDCDKARQRLSGIVGRDTKDIDTRDLCRACVETVAENSNDGVVAPLFYAALAGPVGLWIYKAVNTLDSMVGYRNQQYLHFGWASAKVDDVLNYLPARLTYLLLALAAFLTRQEGRQALRVGWRDARKHPSPNAGWPEAAMAGALGVQLGGPCTYGGVPGDKPLLGDAVDKVRHYHVRYAIQVMHMAAWLALGVACLIAALMLLAPWSSATIGTKHASTAASARSAASWPRTA